MATFVDDVLNPSPGPRQLTRAEQIEHARQRLAQRKADRKIDPSSVTYWRRELTRLAFYLRVEQGEPLACMRWEWVRRVLDYQKKLKDLRRIVEWRMNGLEDNRAKLARGVIMKGRRKGQPYSAVTVRDLQRAIAAGERELAEAEPQIAAFLASAPPSYHVWRRQQPKRSPQPKPALASKTNEPEPIPMVESVAALIPAFRIAFEAAWNSLEDPTRDLGNAMFEAYADGRTADGRLEMERARFDRLPRVLRLADEFLEAAIALEEELWPESATETTPAPPVKATLDAEKWKRSTLALIGELQAKIGLLPLLLERTSQTTDSEAWLRNQLDGLGGHSREP
jgi:hypothetical protein